MLVTDLPDCMIEQIFEYLSYDEIAKQRIVSDVFVHSLFTNCNIDRNDSPQCRHLESCVNNSGRNENMKKNAIQFHTHR